MFLELYILLVSSIFVARFSFWFLVSGQLTVLAANSQHSELGTYSSQLRLTCANGNGGSTRLLATIRRRCLLLPVLSVLPQSLPLPLPLPPPQRCQSPTAQSPQPTQQQPTHTNVRAPYATRCPMPDARRCPDASSNVDANASERVGSEPKALASVQTPQGRYPQTESERVWERAAAATAAASCLGENASLGEHVRTRRCPASDCR